MGIDAAGLRTQFYSYYETVTVSDDPSFSLSNGTFDLDDEIRRERRMPSSDNIINLGKGVG